MRELEELADRRPKDYRVIRRVLEGFAETGRGDIKQVVPGLYRLRGGRWRMYFGRRGDEALFTDLVLRPKAYRHDAVERAMRRLGMMQE